MGNHYDAIVMGVGAMGSATLYALAQRGYNICGIEQFGIAHDRGSSHGETRLIRKAYFEHPDYISLLHRAYEEWEQLEKENSQKLFVKNGLLLAGKHSSRVIKGLRACYSQYDLPHEILSTEEASRRWPVINLPDGLEIYYDPVAGYLHVEECIRQFCRLATNGGADLFSNEKVIRWQADSNHSVSVTTDKQTLSADRLIITCGAWAVDLLQSLTLELQIWHKVLYWFTSQDLAAFHPHTFPGFFIETDDKGYYGFPAVSDSGVKIGEHYGKTILPHPDKLEREVTNGGTSSISDFVGRTFPKLQSNPHKTVACMYTMSTDENFIIDQHPKHKNVIFATGFSGHGFKFAPVIGNILADLAMDGTTGYPIDFLRLKRFESKA